MNSNKTEEQDASNTALSRVRNALFEARFVTLFGNIDQKVTQQTVEQLLALSTENNEFITLFLGSPGGHVESGDTIHDIIRFIEAPVRTVGTGWVGSIATHIYLAAEKENRLCLPNTRFLIHQPSGRLQGDASDISIQVKEIVKIRERINETIATRTGQTLEQVNKDTNRDHWLSAQESLEYGLVGRIIQSVSDFKT
ncbi:MAG: ATP-dependent Clp protease proteolytic subunit [Gammaproteobacteria bacterium]|nr:ATP-dependent Clp protease proteolytic subunit [Gammaproteobacteria bacterium]MYF37285.1 ATP-dependent Clp protease proteolytic subunit [Gammaproteobacteria bacterium]